MRPTAVMIVVGIIFTSVAPGLGAPYVHPLPQRSDISGIWEATEWDPPRGMGEPVSAIMGHRFAVRIEGARITVTFISRDELISMELEVGGRPTRSRLPGIPCQGDSFPYWTAAWDGDTLVLTHTGSEPPGGGDVRPGTGPRRLRLTGPAHLVVERAATRGEEGRVVGSVYRRTSETVASALTALPAVTKASATIADVAWVAGSWRGSASSIATEEYWVAPSSGSMLGLARDLVNDVQVRYEFLCMVERDGSLFYHHAPNGQSVPTRYVLTSVSADSATFENPRAGNPTLIRYARRADGSLEITSQDATGQNIRRQVLHTGSQGGRRPGAVVLSPRAPW